MIRNILLSALLAGLPFYCGAGGVSAQRGNSSDPTSGRIAWIEPKQPKGTLKVRQAKGVKPVNATEGMLVRRGYLLILNDTARAVVVCGDGKRHELGPGLQGCPCKQPCTPEICGIRYDGSTITATRGPDTDKGAFPVVISPRKTLLANLRPTIRWAPIAGAKAQATYNVTMYGDAMKAIWTREVVAATRLDYPDDEPPLAPAKTYKVAITSNGMSSQQDLSPGLGFTTLTAKQAQALSGEESKIKKLRLPDPQTRFFVANLYASRELYAEAIEQTEILYKTMQEPAVAGMLGDLYATIGLNREAERKYLEALRLTPATDFEGRGMIEKKLAQVYEYLGNFDRAVARLREAIAAYRRLKNLRMVNLLLKDERRLKKQPGRR